MPVQPKYQVGQRFRLRSGSSLLFEVTEVRVLSPDSKVGYELEAVGGQGVDEMKLRRFESELDREFYEEKGSG